MNLSRIFILRPIATTLLMLALLFSGLLSYQLLSVSALPQIDYPIIRVSTFYPGASPDVVTSLITAPLERQFGQMPGLAQMTSSSSTGASLITLQFSLDIGLDIAEQEVQAAINAASNFLPNELPNPPVYSKVNPADAPIMTLALTSKILPMTDVENFAETRFSQKISQVSGVGLVSLSGGQRPAVRIQANPTALAAIGLSLDELQNAIVTGNANLAKGNFDGNDLAYTINANDQLLNAKAYQSLIIAYKNGAPVRIEDVATVIDGPENSKQAAWINNEPAIILNIQRQPGANVIKVVESINKLLPQIRNSLPNTVELTILTDRTLTIKASVFAAKSEMLLAILLVILIIFIFLMSARATFIPSISVPLSLIGTFSFMTLFGYSINNLTLMALTIATGFVVDDAIVMIENISRYIENGESPMEAALKGAKQIGFTIISLTISLIAVLIPLLFMQDVIGKLFREFALTLSITILLSAFISLTLTPMLCARLLLAQASHPKNRFEQTMHRYQNQLIVFYQKALSWVLSHQPLTLAIALMTIVLTLLLMYVIPKGFFPTQDTGIIQGISEAPASISFLEMSKRQQQIAQLILEDEEVASLSSFIGIDGTNATLNNGRLQINLKPLSKRKNHVSNIIRRLNNKIHENPDITLYLNPLQDFTIDDKVSKTQYQLSLSSPDSMEVIKWNALMLKKLQTLPEIQDVASDQSTHGLQIMLTIDRDAASKLGITAQMIDNTLYNAFGQRQISTMFTQLNQHYVILEVLPSMQDVNQAFENIYLHASDGKVIPLSTLIHITRSEGPLLITRMGQFPAAIISFNLAPNASIGQAVKAILKAQEELQLPLSLHTSFEGAAKAFENALANEGWLVLAAILVVYIVLGVLYESYIHPITILSTLPSAGMGALLALWITGKDLSVVALIGIILLIGIVMKNAIMMIDFALELERKEGKTPYDAIFEACVLRFRPILMTTLAALFGAIPLALGTGMGAELRQPLGIAIIGGLIVSQLLTLFTTPVIYLTFDKLRRNILGNAIITVNGNNPITGET